MDSAKAGLRPVKTRYIPSSSPKSASSTSSSSSSFSSYSSPPVLPFFSRLSSRFFRRGSSSKSFPLHPMSRHLLGVEATPVNTFSNNQTRRRKRMDDDMFYFQTADDLANKVFGDWRQSPKPGKIPHDETAIRKRKGEILPIPQAKRYVSRDWLHILGQLPRSVTLKRIRAIVVWNSLWALAIALLNHFVFPFPHVASGHGPTLVTPALGLLLVFRTNAAYNRFWEGRIVWEKITDSSRSLARMAVLHCNSAGPEAVDRIARLLAAFAIVLKQHLTEFRFSESQFVEQSLLDKQNRIMLGRAQNRPLAILHMLGRECHAIPDTKDFASRERLTMLRCVDQLTESMGAAERIVQTPVPLNYARHTSRFLTFWCLTLPIAIVGELGFTSVPVMALVTWALFGIQEIGLMIEEPFRRSLSLNVFCNTIYTDVMETVQSLSPLANNTKPAPRLPSELSRNFPGMPPAGSETVEVDDAEDDRDEEELDNRVSMEMGGATIRQ
eukprot:CAMPEP_0184495254 /NCGR_PEP_ID=MMETSP0113_2-20130426/30792_1 /TAXON_ID=91329 /ORGANISM="Norrisiella sphaerica, Strain BC52" /LENGTH=496 /DNA_ID=CAMNT_0026881365 /DNA_START=464 /DNA_END=1954 /DNA_ORIENTATION=+